MSSARWQTPTTSAAIAARIRSAAPGPRGAPAPATVAKRRVGSIETNASVSGETSSSASSPSSTTTTAAPAASAASSRVPMPALSSPEARPGSQRARCSSLPAAWMTAAAAAVERKGVAAQA